MPEQPTVTQVASDSSRVILRAVFPQFEPKKLFDYFTVPHLLELWWPAAASTEPWPGGSYHLSWPAMNWHLRGEYTALEPGKRLAFSWRWDHEPDLPTRQVEILFEPAGDGCRLIVIHGTYDDSPRDQEDRQSHLDGWTHFLGQLQALT